MQTVKSSSVSSRIISPFLIVMLGVSGLFGFHLVRELDRLRAEKLYIEKEIEARSGKGTLSGNYLAGRYAAGRNDLEHSADYAGKALAYDPENIGLLFESLRRFVIAGRMDEAIKISERMEGKKSIDALATMVLLASQTQQGEYDKALEFTNKEVKGGLYEIVQPLLRQWLALGAANKISYAPVSLKVGFMTPFLTYHQALIYDAQGKSDDALKHYLLARGEPESTPYRVTQALANFYLRQGEKDKAKALYEDYREHHPSSGLIPEQIPDVDTAADKIRPLVANPAEGFAEIFFTTASLLYAEQAVDETLLYLRLGLYLRPDFPPAQLMLANVLEQAKDYRGAITAYEGIDPNTVFYRRGLVRTALNYEVLGDTAKAIRLLEDYARRYPDDAEASATLGDIYRSKQQFLRAAEAYGEAIRIKEPLGKDDWQMLYARGMSYERAKQWNKAEPDFVRALELNPDEPDVLNYLGYSWLVQDMHVKKAKRYIQKAVEQRPFDAHIIDSMGWAYFMTGDFDRAVEFLEQAVDLAPQDPTINDHLGDGYFRVGREVEATFQWERALTFKPEEADAKAIRAKLDAGGLPALPAKAE